MKKLLLLMLLVGFTSMAQIREKGTIELVPLIGYSDFHYADNNGNSSESLSSANFGLDADYYFNKSWSLRSGLIFQTMGTSVSYYPFIGSEKLEYLNIPLNANWHFGSTKKWNLNFGLTPSFLLSANGDYDQLGKIDLKEYTNSFQLGLSFGIGYKIEVSKKFSILVDYQGFAGLTDVNKSTVDGSIKNSGFNFNVGGVFQL